MAYADRFVLQVRLFADAVDPAPYAWTDITYLLHVYGVSWGYFVGEETCIDPDPGDPWSEFDFSQEPIPPLILDPRP